MADWLTTYDDIADELERIGFKPDSQDRYTFTGRTLYARIIEEGEQTHTWMSGQQKCEHVTPKRFVVHFAERKTFDRWANSTNFIVPIDPEHPKADLQAAKVQAEKICRAEVFDFNSYFHPIDLS